MNVLKKAVGAFLRKSPHVEKFYPAGEQESAMLERLSTLREYRDGLLHEAAEGAQGDEFEQDLEEGQEPGDELEPAAAGVDEERP